MGLTLWQTVGVFLLAFPITLLSIAVHEGGHAVCAAAMGFRVSAIGFGVAQPFWVRSWCGIRFYLCRQQPLQAITWVLGATLFPTRRQTVWMLFGGPLANLLLGTLALLLFLLFPRFGISSAALAQAAFINLFFGIANLLPFQHGRPTPTLRSDGYQIRAALRRGGVRPVTISGTNLALRSLWEAIGDRAMLQNQLLQAAANALEIGDTAPAQQWYNEAQTLSPSLPETDSVRGLTALVAAALRREEGDTNGADALLAHAETTLTTKAEPDRLLLLINRRDTVARERLAAAEESPIFAELPHLQTAYWWARLAIAIDERTDAVERCFARYEAARRIARSDALDLNAYRIIAEYREATGDRSAAAVAYEQALRAAALIYTALAADNAAQTRFAERQTPLREKAAACFRALGRTAEAEQFTKLLSATA